MSISVRNVLCVLISTYPFLPTACHFTFVFLFVPFSFPFFFNCFPPTLIIQYLSLHTLPVMFSALPTSNFTLLLGWQKPKQWVIPGLEITAGQRTMSGLIWELTGQPFVLPVMLTGHI